LKNAAFLKIVFITGKILFLPSNFEAMKKLMKLISVLLVGILLFISCASSRSRAMRKAERQMEQMERKSKKQYERAKTTHYKRQAKKTKKMIQKDKRHAERMRRRQKTNPFF
jgi:ABC-type nickel/cobalt efflux system permease component RcnA